MATECKKSLIKKLASCDKNVRDRSVRAVLQNWLPNQTEVSDEDMKKLWQGLFYCMWHADKVPYQSELIERLSSAVESFPLPISVNYFSVFLFTMRREWSRTDRLRLDKFYLLIRRFLHTFFVLLKNNSWDLDFTRRLMSVLFDGTLLADDKFQGNGVNYHIASVFVGELKPFLPLSKEVVELLFGPFVSVLSIVDDKVLVGKIKSDVFDDLLKMGKKLLDVRTSGIDVDSNDDAVILGSIALSLEFSRKFYDLGSSPDCRQGNRKSIFALHEEFSKLEKDMASSGIEISIAGTSDRDNDSEAKDVITNGSSKKKRKKEKKGLKKCSKAKEASKKEADIEIPNIQSSDGNDESLISNLQLQFEKVAEELGSKDEIASACDENSDAAFNKSKKRKRKNKTGNRNETEESSGKGEAKTKTDEKSKKRVKFSMKSNIEWKPHSPLPPQSLRLPPSATPRGSALKQGVPAGPVKEIPKARLKAKGLKKVRKGVKTIKMLKKKKSSP